MSILEIILTNSVAITISTLFLTFWLDKRKDNYTRQMDKRKELYTQTHNLLSFWFSTVNEKQSNEARGKLLESYRNFQIWASDDVFFSFKKFLTIAMDESSTQDMRNAKYKELVLTMRKDLLGRNTKVTIDDIEIRGIQDNKDQKTNS